MIYESLLSESYYTPARSQFELKSIGIVLTLLALCLCLFANNAQGQTIDEYQGLVAVRCDNPNTSSKIITTASGHKVLCTTNNNLREPGFGHAKFIRGFYVFDYFYTQQDEAGGSVNSYLTAKYGTDPQAWAGNEISRIEAWGMNVLAPYYSANALPTRTTISAQKIPFVMFISPSAYAFTNQWGRGTGPVKDIFYVLSSTWGGYKSGNGLPDYHDQKWQDYVRGTFANDDVPREVLGATAANKGYLDGVSVDDSDYLHGFGAGPESTTRPSGFNDFRLGYTTLFAAPVNYANSRQGQIYTDGSVFLKKRMHDLLVAKYSTVQSCSGGAVGIQGLNTCWGASYTSFDSSGTCVGSQPVACQSSVPADTIGTGNGSQVTFTATLSRTTVSKLSLAIYAGANLAGGDTPEPISTGGTFYKLFGPTLDSSNSNVNHTTGAITVTFTSPPGVGVPITAAYIANGWGFGTGFMDEDCRPSHAAYCGDGTRNTTIYLTNVPVNVQGDINAFTRDAATHYSSVINSEIQLWATSGPTPFVGHVNYFGPATLGGWSAPPDQYVLQGFAGNVDAIQIGGVSTLTQSELDFIRGNMGDIAIIEAEYRTANAQSPFSWPNSSATYNASTGKVTITTTANNFRGPAGGEPGDLIDVNGCADANYNVTQIHLTAATTTSVEYPPNVTPTSSSTTGCNLLFDDNNVGGFATQAARGSDFQTAASALPARMFTTGGVHPYIGYFWWQYTDNELERLNWGVVTLRDNSYDGNEDVNAIVTCSNPVQPPTIRCGGELRGPYGSLIPYITQTNTAIDNAVRLY